MSRPWSASILLICGLLSVVLHAIVIAAVPVEERRPVQVQPRRPSGVLLVQPQPVVEPPSGGGGGGVPAAEPAEAVAPLVTAASEAPAPVTLSGAATEGDYVPRPLLTVAPQPQTPVMLTWPDFGGTQSEYRGVLALYIDDQGVVQRIRTMEGDLPPELEAQARAVFAGVRFAPGELDGVAVRSRVQVEVVFEKPEPPPSAARGLVH